MKKLLGDTITFLGNRGHFTPKMNITFFYHKLGTTYFYVKQFFRKKQNFPRKRQNTVLVVHLIIF